MARTSKRDLLLDTAERLFTQDGFTATGINLVIREAGTVSATLYKNFSNKDDLILAVIARRHQQMMDELEAALNGVGEDPSACILAVFDYIATYARDPALSHPSDGSFTGCIFQHAASEFRAFSHPIHQAAAEHQKQLLDLFEEKAEALGHPSPEALAQTLLLLVNGAFASAQITGDLGLFDRARHAAETLIGPSH